MMKISTSPSLKRIIRNVLTFAVVVILTLIFSKSYSQTKIYANTATASGNATSLTGCGVLGLGACSVSTVDNPTNATTDDENTFATVKSSGGIALNILAYSGELELKFPSNVPANTTTYIRIDSDPDLLNALLGGNLGGLLANVLGNVALGNHSFYIAAKNAAGTIVTDGASSGQFTNSNLRLVKDGLGRFYVAITPNQIYDRVVIRDNTSTLLLGTNNSTRVYYAFHTSGTDPCAQAFATSFEGTGITLDALRLGNSGVINSDRAIDADPNNFSQISLGVLAVGGTASQIFYFTTPSNPTDDFNLRFKTSAALLNLGLLNNIRVTAYNGNTEVYTQVLNPNLLSLELLTLLNNGSIVNLPFSPGVPFDRVKVTLSSLVNANLTQTIDVYGLTRSAGRPTFTAPSSNAVAACYNVPVALTATTANTNELLWYENIEGGTPLATVAFNGTFTTPGLTANKTYYVAARRLNCPTESTRVPVVLTIDPQINFAGTTLTNATSQSAYNRQITPATGGTPGFTYALAPGSTLPAGLTLSTSGNIAGIPTVPNVYNFSIVATDTKGCNVTAPYTLTVTAALTLTAGALPEGITGTAYPAQTIPAAAGGTGPYTYAAVNLPPGLVFNPATREITGTPTTPGNYTVPVTVTDANGNTVTANYTIKVTNPFILPSATLAIGTTGSVYTPQFIPSATGGTTPYTYTATGLPAGLTFNPVTRAITGTPTVAGSFTVAVTATDADGKTVTTNYALTVINPLILPSATLPDGTENVAYSSSPLPAATGGVGPYTYLASNIPAGLSYNPLTRQLSGTPTQAGNYALSITATDSEGRTATNNYALRVIGTLTLPSSTLPNGIVGTGYPAQTIPAVSGGTGPYTYVAVNLPSGLTFDPTTRVISGTPTQGGTYNVQVTATDVNNNKATTSYGITVDVNAPVVASTTVCSGSGASLTVSNVVPNVSYRLYGPTGNTVLQTSTSGTFTTPVVTSQTTFFVEAFSGTAVSSRTAVTVSVNPPATLAIVTTSSQVINAGQTATLTATADAGNTIAWFDAATGGTQVGTGGSFTTPALQASATYYVQTTSAAGCVSASRVPVTVTIITGGGNTICNTANSQNSGITGVCALCAIVDAGNSTDSDPNNVTKIQLSVGIGASGYQQLIFPGAGTATDSIRLDLGLPVGLADVGIFNNITIRVLNGTSVVKTVQVGSGLLNLSLLGGSRFAATLVAGGVYDRVQVNFTSVVSALRVLDIYGATVIYPNPTVTAGAQSICAGGTANLAATANGGTTLTWFDAPTGGTQLGAGETFTTSAISATTTYYIQVNKANCANTARIPVVVTVNPAIIFTGTTLTNATIASAYSRQLPVATGGTPGFTYALAPGSTLPAGLALSSTGLISGTPTATGTPTFNVVVTDTKNCSVTATFNLTVTPALTLAPAALVDGVTGTPYVTQTIPAAAGGTGPYTYTANGLPPGLTFDPTTREITGTPTQIGNYTIPVTVTDVNGNTITANYTIKVTDPLVLPTATLASGVKGSVYPMQTIPSATGGTTPYTYSATGLPLGLAFNPATREITGTPTESGTFTIQVTVTDAAGKTATTNYAITVIDPLVLPPATLANGTENVAYPVQNIPAATGGVGPYTYTAIGLPPGLSFDPATRDITGTPTQAGNYVVSVTVTDGQGRTASNNYGITVIGALSLPTATLPNGIVGDIYAGATLPAVTGGTGPYTYLATNIPAGLSFNTTTREITGTPTVGGTFTVSLTATDANGNKATTGYNLTVTVNAPVVAAATVCVGSPATLTVSNLQAGVTYNWYAATGNTPLATNNTGAFTTPAITAQTVFYVEAVSGTAISPRTAVNVSVNPSATLATVTTNSQVINTGQSTTLLATADTGNTIAWFDAPTGGTQVGTGTSFVTPVLNATTTYYVETTNGTGCVSASRVPVTVTVIPGGTGTACNAANTQNSGITGICLLCGITDAGNSTDNDVTNATRITLGVGVASSGYQQLIFPTAGTATDSVRLDLALPGGLLDLQLLNNITVNILNGATVVRTVQLGSSLLNLQLLSGSRFAATIAAGGAFDRVEVRIGALVSAVTSLDIYGATIVYPNPTVAAAAQTICAGSTATLTATANGGTTLAWYNAPIGGTQLAVGETFTTPALANTTTYYIQVSKGTCPNPIRVPVTVNVIPALATPVVATVAANCAGTPVTLSVTNPVAGVTYNWYDAATGGNLLFAGSVVTTPALSANTTYYVQAAQGSCVSATRAAVSVTVNPRPVLPVITASASTIAPGQTVILTATSTDPAVTFNWYSSANATAPIYTGATYVTPPLTTTTTYFVETVAANGCTSASRVQVTVTVDGNGAPNPVPCESATAQTSGVTGVALLAGVFNQGLAIDNDTQTASSLVLPVGALGASVYQRASFGSVSQPGDTVLVLVSSPGRLLSLSLLGNAQITTYLGTNSNGDSRFLNNNLLNVQLLNGGTQALITFVPAATFDAVEVRLNGGALGVLNSLNFNYAQRILVAPEVVSANVTACTGQTTQLVVNNPSSGLTYRWYDSAGTYLTGKDGIIFTSPVLTGDTRFFVAAVSASGCVSARTVVDVTVNPAPVTPELLDPDVTACLNTTVIFQVKNPVAGTIYKWYDAANVYQAGLDGTTFTVANVTTNTTYTVEAVNSCSAASARATATIAIGNIDAPVVTPAAVTISENSVASLTATSSTAGATINWYTSATATTPIFTGPNYVTGPLSSNTTFYVEATVPGGCTSTRTAVVVTVIPNGTPVPTPCGAAITQTNGVSGGITIGAGVINPTQAIDGNINTGSSLVIPVGLLGSSVFQQLGFSGLSNVGDTLRVKITTPGQLLTVGLLSNLTLTTYQGTTTNNDAILISNPLISINLLTGSNSAILTFVPTNRFDGVELRLNSGLLGALNSVNFDYAQRSIVAPTVIAATVSACQGSSATLSVQNPQSGITYRWYLGGVYQTGKDGTTFITDAALAAGTYNYAVSANADGCETVKVPVTVTVTAPPAPPVLATTNPSTTCINTSATLTVVPVAGNTYNWYDAAVNGNMLVTNNSSFTTATNLTAGTYDYYVEAVNANGCSNPTRTKATITILPAALAADISITGNTAVCASAITTLIAASTTVINPVFTWYSDAALTQVVSTSATFTTPAITASTTYYVTVRGDNKCANGPGNAQVITITNNPVATVADITLTGPTSICGGATVTLSATSTTVINPVFTWYNDAALTSVAFTGANFNTPVLTATATYFVTVKGDNKCENTPATARAITITVNPFATGADINLNGVTSVCVGSTTQLSASSTTVTNPVFTWYSNAALTTVAFVGASFNTPVLTSSVTYYVTVRGDNKCENPANAAGVVNVTVKPYATAADITVANTQICAGSTTMLMASSLTVTQPVFTWYTDASLTSVAFVGPNFTVNGLTSTTTYYVTVKGTNKCENTAVDAKVVVVTVNPLATTTDIILNGGASACAGSTTTLTATSPTVTNPVFTWYSDPELTNISFIGNVFVTPVLNTTTTYYVTVKGDNKCENAPNTGRSVTIMITPVAGAGDVTATDATICQGTSAALVATSTTVTNPTFTWYNDAALTSVAFVGANFNTPLLNTTTRYYLTVKGDNRCESSTANARVITVNVNEAATAADITLSAPTLICGSGTATLAASSTTVTNPVFTWYSDASLTSVAFVGPNFTTPVLTATTTYYVTVKGTNKCENTAVTAKPITIIVNPRAVQTDITVTGSTSICGNVAAVLTANSTTVTNPVFTWYSDAALTSVAFVGSVFTTPVLTANTTYYVTVKGDNKCENASGSALAVVLTVTPIAGAGDVAANDATICAGTSAALVATTTTVTNPTFTWYNDAALTSVAFVGATFNTPVLTTTIRYYLTIKGDNRCESSTANARVITVNVNEAATAADITLSAPTLICGSGTATLAASSTTVTNPVFTWYSDASLTSVAFVGPNFTTPALTATTTYYVTVKGTNKCENTAATAKPITVVVNPRAVQADVTVTGSRSICGNVAAVLTASSTTVTNPVFTWYSDAALTSVAFVGSVFTTPVLTANTTYYVTVKGDNKCENASGSALAVVLTVTPIAGAGDVTATDATICAGTSAALLATSTTVTNPTFTWYNDAALTSVAFVGATFSTPVLTTTTRYYLTIKGDNRCESSAATARVITVNVNEAATAADIILSAPTLVCGSGTATINASSTTVTNPVFTWYSDASLTSVAFVGPNFTTPALTATTTYYVTVKGTNRCENTAATAKPITVVVNPRAVQADVTVTGSRSICGNVAAVLTASSTTVTNPVFTWYSDAALTSVAFVGSVFTTPVLTANTTYYVTVKGDNKCENASGSALAIALTVRPVAGTGDVTATDATICAGSMTTLTAVTSTVTNPIFTWYNDAALTSVAFVGATFNTPVLTTTTRYYLTVKGDNRCESSAATARLITVNVNEAATAADITLSAPTLVCGSGTATINASSTTVTNPVFTWYSDASLTSVAFVGPNFTTPALTATTTYYVTVKGTNRCENTAAAAKPITVIVNPRAVQADVSVSGSRSICGSVAAVLTASSTTVTNPVFTWYNDAALTSVAFVGSVFTTPVLTANTTYYVTVKGDNKCENASGNGLAIAVTVNSLPNNPVVASTGTSICSGEPTQLIISNAQTGITYEWYSAAVGGNLLFTGSTYNTPALSSTTDYFVTAINAGGCNNNGGRVRITVTVNQRPAVPVVNVSNISTCIGSVAVITVSNPQTGAVYNWYTAATGGSIAGTGVSFTTPTVTTNVTYYVEGANGSCISASRTPVNVTALQVPLAPASATPANGIICAGSNTILTVNNPVAGLIYKWYSVSSNGNVLGEGITFTTPNITATTIYYVESIAVGGCASASRTPVTVTVLPVLATPAVVVQSTTANSVTFAWPAVNGASGYQVSTDNGLTWQAAVGTTYLASGLKPDQSVTLIVRATGQLACQTSANSSPVTGKATNPFGSQIYIPNAFTPNNDGKNDTFLIYGNTIASARMSVFTQWGQLIFQSDNMSNGWDGTFKGVNQPVGVYVYMVEAQFNDGTSTMKKGTVTLIR
ncbi:putative Ig domain-containing protein [Pedobacter sp. CFBP9032]|uniref:Ig-like domain-containing protein n=1 Tax=Pedobacter sp. CFBP9032 TaxID=3096539 RepID=UPI002A6A750D|nr:putative Ig domain-containing protein [Pedobacter sp. CFBP9032]MDY0903604.1 putative Ig domain-containing protein [Pedobacter sp. CFBP9032]